MDQDMITDFFVKPKALSKKKTYQNIQSNYKE